MKIFCKMEKTLLLFLFISLLACNPRQADITSTPAPEPEPIQKPKNIILMIGDGMGVTQITAGMYANGNYLNLEKFPIVGLQKTYSQNNLITDSAAGATAFACGIKSYNGAIGVDSDTIAHQTILEEAEKNDYATGMVVTSTIVHATPAAFISHVKQRNEYENIATDFLKTEIDFFVGGGEKYFNQREKDDRNLIKELTQKGYVTSDFRQKALKDISIDDTKNFAYFTSNSDPLPYSQGRDYLVEASKKAVNFLKNHSEKGFFLMVEGSQIDWGGHAKDSKYIISEMIEFDNAIGEVLNFAKKDGETLVIVTADHETGGFAINPGSTMDNIVPDFTTDGHTAIMVPVFAYGPGAELFGGIYENTAIYKKMKKAFDFNDIDLIN